MRKFFLFMVLGLVLIFSSSVQAQVTLDKREVLTEVGAGETATGSIVIQNVTPKDVVLKAYFEDVTFESPFDGLKIKALSLGSTPYSCGKFVELSLGEFIIPAKGKQELGYTIKLPADAKGTYYGMLFLESGQSAGAEGTGVGLIIKNGCKFFIETKGSSKKADISDISGSGAKITGTLLNSGEALVIAQASYYIMDDKGVVAERGEIGKFYLPEGAKTDFALKTGKQISEGSYILGFNLDLGGGNVILKEIEFSKDAEGNLKVGKIKE